jgi:transcriptional regulator with XRE-family HTH domain
MTSPRPIRRRKAVPADARASPPDQSELLGMRLAQMRRQNGWTLAQVSARTGLAISTLSKVERNQISLTYNRLAQLAAGLKLDVAEFFAVNAIDDTYGRRVYCRRSEGHTHETANYAHQYFAAELLHRRMIPMQTRIKTRTLEEFGPLDRHLGEEYVYVLEGAIEMHIEPEGPVRLRAGDSCYFDARSGHAAISVGSGDALVLSIISAPGAGPSDVPLKHPRIQRAKPARRRKTAGTA